jgi:hypothetical protein
MEEGGIDMIDAGRMKRMRAKSEITVSFSTKKRGGGEGKLKLSRKNNKL